MKIKMMPMLLTLLIFAVIALACGSPIYAQDSEPDIDVTDDVCTQDEKDRLLCFEAVGGAYVVQIFVDFPVIGAPEEENEKYKNPTKPDENGNIFWPIVDPVAQTREYRYRASVREGQDCKGVDTWNYFIQKQSASIADDLVMTDPPGAQLLIPGNDLKKCYITAQDDEVLLKLNPSLNCAIGNYVVFSLTYTTDVLVGRCNQSVVLTKSGCGDPDYPTYILGPSPGSLPFHARQYHETFGGSVEASFVPGPCGATEEVLVEEVIIDDQPTTTANPAWVCTPYTAGDLDPEEEYIYVVDLGNFGDMLCIKPDKAGLQNQGCVIDANPRTYLFGGDAYTRP